jgi:hypothetical protein
MRFSGLALALAACGPQTGILFDVQGPSGVPSAQAGIAAVELRLAHQTFCDRWVEDADARVTVDVHGRDLENAPLSVLVRPPRAVELADPVLALALARDQNGNLLGAAEFAPHPFSLHQYLEFGERVALFDLTQPVAQYVPDGGCACVPGAPWIGSGAGQGCDLAVVTSFEALRTTAGCELPAMSPESLGPACDGQRYPLTYYREPSPRDLPCFAPAPGGGGCAVGTRQCQDSDGVAYTGQCAPDGNAPVMTSNTLCAAYQGCEGCGDLLSCFRGKLGPAIEYRCLVHLDPQQSAPAPCQGGPWQSPPLGQASAGCQAVMLEGLAQPPYTVGFAGSGGGDPQAIAACPASIVIGGITPAPKDDLSIPHDLYFTVGDQLGHATLTVVRECGQGASLECHSG